MHERRGLIGRVDPKNERARQSEVIVEPVYAAAKLLVTCRVEYPYIHVYLPVTNAVELGAASRRKPPVTPAYSGTLFTIALWSCTSAGTTPYPS